MSRHILYEGKRILFREMPNGKRFIEVRRRIGSRDVCPLCKQIFRKSTITSVVLITSSQVDIPNRFVHSECLVNKTDEYAFKLIAEDYEEAKKYSDWF